MVEVAKYGFYTVNPDYLKYLNEIDSEVYYNSSYRKSIKPFVGIIVGIKNYYYFIPISSAKEKHIRWKNVSDEHFLIYEVISKSITIKGDIYKYYSDKEKMHVLSILDQRYKDLFEKEYAFCLKIKNKILKKVEKIYNKQKTTGIVRKSNCNFLELEKAMMNWQENI